MLGACDTRGVRQGLRVARVAAPRHGAAQSTLESGNSTLHGRRLFSSCFSQLRRGSSNRGVRGRMPALGDARDGLQSGSRRLCPPYSTGFSEYWATRQYVWRLAPRAPRRLGGPCQLQTCESCHSNASHHLKAACRLEALYQELAIARKLAITWKPRAEYCLPLQTYGSCRSAGCRGAGMRRSVPRRDGLRAGRHGGGTCSPHPSGKPKTPNPWAVLAGTAAGMRRGGL